MRDDAPPDGPLVGLHLSEVVVETALSFVCPCPSRLRLRDAPPLTKFIRQTLLSLVGLCEEWEAEDLPDDCRLVGTLLDFMEEWVIAVLDVVLDCLHVPRKYVLIDGGVEEIGWAFGVLCYSHRRVLRVGRVGDSGMVEAGAFQGTINAKLPRLWSGRCGGDAEEGGDLVGHNRWVCLKGSIIFL